MDAKSLEMDIAVDDLKLGDEIGAGNFSKVYKGVWRGRDVAIKRQQLPEQKELDKLVLWVLQCLGVQNIARLTWV